MQFTASKDATEEIIWDLILNNLGYPLLNDVSPATSAFFRTEDGLECSVRRRNGDLIAHCYSESDRMGKRRWTIDIK